MNVISMLEDYRAMCAAAEDAGKFEAYRAYTKRYPVLFDAVQRYLYQCPLEALQEYVETADFTALLRQGEENHRAGLFEQTHAFVSECSTKMDVQFPFDLYLGLELGNIGGASLPTESGEHFVYIGMDRPIDEGFLRIFVPHELHHLLRIHHTGEKESTTLRTRMVSEGLASYCPLWYYDLPWNAETVSQSLGIKPAQSAYMLAHAQELAGDLWAEGDIPLDPAVMAKYFAAQEADGDVRVPGYFVGMWLTHLLLEQGQDFMHLTTLPTRTILQTATQGDGPFVFGR